ncbi:hypothetical protein LAZ67_14001495 [Cordylochernes scorpioides]|uniref:Uncharacterized protein n=1 Tax=Cordylochernes scorpioides TaxID=51811 RepID=A0ABY6L8S2_9ARAC|nr:hypothetical protein LAZ67_14001495 [Cordylochernes scorpioides]
MLIETRLGRRQDGQGVIIQTSPEDPALQVWGPPDDGNHRLKLKSYRPDGCRDCSRWTTADVTLNLKTVFKTTQARSRGFLRLVVTIDGFIIIPRKPGNNQYNGLLPGDLFQRKRKWSHLPEKVMATIFFGGIRRASFT